MKNVQNTKVESDGKHEIIVSITCISHRISYILPVLKSLLNQSMQPDKIILWVSSEKFLNDEGIKYNKIPRIIRTLAESEENVFEIHFTENIGPYRKLLPVLEKYNTSRYIIVTADDDIIYPDYWLKRLYTEYIKNKCIITYRARKILFDNNNLQPYSSWPVLEHWDNRKELYLCPTGNNGVLYSPSFFDERIFDPIFREICPSRSDIWFSTSAIANKIQTNHLDTKALDIVGHNIKDSRFPRLSPDVFLKKLRRFKWPELWHYNRPLNDDMISKVFKYYSLPN